MKKIVYTCDSCNYVRDPSMFVNLDAEYHKCDWCVKVEHKRSVEKQNRENAQRLKACDKCKQTGILHKSIYACGPGYFDEPDPTIYCECSRGLALNPNTPFVVTGFERDNNDDYT